MVLDVAEEVDAMNDGDDAISQHKHTFVLLLESD
jgi:hypothetical protein